jgi:hypothetical protein
MEIKPRSIAVCGNSCIGCKANNSEIMITVLSGEGEDALFIDLFLSNIDAIKLIEKISERVADNYEKNNY